MIEKEKEKTRQKEQERSKAEWEAGEKRESSWRGESWGIRHYLSKQRDSVRSTSPPVASYDFLGLQSNEYALKVLQQQGEYIHNVRIFSDYVSRIN